MTTIGYEYRPRSLYLNVTNRCSNNCTFCVRQSPSFSLAGFDMRLEREPTAAEVLADISRKEAERGRPFDEVVFCGFGEPTYRLALIGVVGRTLCEQGRHVRLNTKEPGCTSDASARTAPRPRRSERPARSRASSPASTRPSWMS